MGKKVYHQISKSSNKEKHQLRSLITELKPKVYITESSNFRKLVQELTGNRNTITSSTAFMEIKFAEEVVAHRVNNKNVVYDETDDCQNKNISSSSRGGSSSVEATSSLVDDDFIFIDSLHRSENQFHNSVEFSHSIDSTIASPISSYNTCCSTFVQGYDLSNLQLFCLDNSNLQEHSTPHEQLEDLFSYQELDSFLVDNAETSSLYDFFAQIEQEVSLYDYEFAGFM